MVFEGNNIVQAQSDDTTSVVFVSCLQLILFRIQSFLSLLLVVHLHVFIKFFMVESNVYCKEDNNNNEESIFQSQKRKFY